MKLAKPFVDVGLLTRDPDSMLAFWRDEIGLAYEERLDTGGGGVQHRLDLAGSVLKVNVVAEASASQPPGGIREILIARDDVTAPRRLVDPDGNAVALVPNGHEGVSQIGIVLRVRDAAAFDGWFGDVLQLDRLHPGAHRCGETLLFHDESEDAVVAGAPSGVGYRYLTIQVYDCAAEHAGILARGGAQGLAPTRMRDVAKISMVCDPDGGFAEISQRASLTGPLD